MKKTLLCFLLLFTISIYSQSGVACAGETFDLPTIATGAIGNLNPNNASVSYHYSLADVMSNSNPIANPSNYNATYASETIYVRIEGVETSPVLTLTQISALNVSASNKPILCNGESSSLSINVSGGSGSYSYSLNGGAFTTQDYYPTVSAGVYNITVLDNANGCKTSISYTITEPTALVATSAIVNQNVIIVTATGGTGPYQYSLDGINYQSNNYFTIVGPGNYNIRVTDAEGCRTIVNTTVTPFLNLTAFVTKDLDCSGNGNNGIVTADATGGQGPYTYSINGSVYQASNVFNNLAAGTYSITVKDALNSVSNPFVVTIAPLVNVTGVALVTNATSCSNASITVQATSGQAPYVYSIDNGQTFTNNNIFSNLAPGNYVFQIKDSKGCVSAFLSNTVQPPAPLLTTAVATTPIMCSGEKSTLTVAVTGGQTPYQYSINNGIYTSNNVFTNLSAGDYIIKVQDANGCISALPYVITEPAPLNGVISIEEQTISVINVTGGTGSYFYAIDNGNFQMNNVFTNVAPGLHNVKIKDSNNCESSFSAEIASPVTAVVAIAKEIDCMSDAEIVVTASGGIAPYTYSMNGVTFQASNIFTNIAAGTYSIIVKDANGTLTTANNLIISPPSYPVITLAKTNATCFQASDGIITASTTGGKAPYLYSIGNNYSPVNTFTGLAAGFYNVIVKDANGCLSSFAVNIDQPNVIVPTVSTTNSTSIADNDGAITVNATGGVPPYAYSLKDESGLIIVPFQTSNVFNGLKSGLFGVEVRDSNGCFTTQNNISIINNISTLSATATITNQPTCNNPYGTITVNAVGGTAPYTYSFDNGITYSVSNTLQTLPGNYLIKVKDAQNSETSITITLIAPVPLATTATLTKTIDCLSNGIITASATGGQAPYFYSFDNGNTYMSSNTFSNAVAGVYSVIVKDSNNCISTVTSITVDPIATLTATATITKEADCIEGSFRVYVTGGKSPYQYSIDNGPYGTLPVFYKQAGTYTINVKDNANCIATTIVTLNPYTAVTATVIPTNATCGGTADGAIKIYAKGGVPPYTYSLDGTTYQTSDTFNNLIAKTYTIRIKDNSRCVSNVTAIITQPTNLVVTSTMANVSCKGSNNGSVTLTASGGKSPYSYSKDGITYFSNPNFTSLTAGTYNFFIKDANGCINSYTSTVTEPSALELITDIKTLNNDEQIGALIRLDAVGGTAPYLYSVKNETSGIVYGQNTYIKTYSGMSAGLYTISVVDANGCQTTKSNINITLTNPIILNSAKTYPTCVNNYGSISVNPSGGVPPYYYSTNGGVTYTTENTGRTNLPIGNHSILIEDAIGNAAQTHIIVKAYAPPKMTAVVSYETANNRTSGVITVSTTGGTAPYYYTIKGTDATRLLLEDHTSTIYSGLLPDTYSIVSKDANGCESEKTEVTLTIPAPILISAVNTPALTCSNSTTSLTFSASGGTAPYLYSPNAGRTYFTTGTFTVGAGTHSLYVKDALGNTSWISYVIKPYVPVTGTAIKKDVNCSGSQDGNVQILASGGIAPYTYSLDQINYSSNNSFSNLKAGTYNGTIKDAANCSATFQFTIVEPAPLSISNTASNNTNVNSNDGKITVTPSGGTAPYIYSLKNGNGSILIAPQTSNIFTGLSVGQYTIEVKDANGCIASKSGITITSEVLFGTLITTPITCTTLGTITINAAGGKYPHQYSFDNGATYSSSNIASNLNAGTYTIKVKDASDNTITLSATLTPVNPVVITASIASPVYCTGSNDAVIQVVATGGKAPYIYSLNGSAYQSNNSFFNLSAGNYVITAKDSNECSSTMVVTITEPNPLAVTATVENQNITVTATGGNGGYRYAISPNLNLFSSNNTFSNLSPGSYSIATLDLYGCVVMINVVVDPVAPTVNGQSNLTVEFKEGQTLADLIVEGENIKWYSSPNSSAGKTSKSNETPLPLTTVLVNGTTYYASQTINGIESKERLAITAKVNGSLSTPDFNLVSFQFYPNPVKDILTVKNDSVINDIEIISVSGTSVLFKTINDTHSEIDLSNLSSGLYLLKVKSENQQRTIKLIKR